MSCRFCEIVDEKEKMIFQDELISVFLDMAPIAPGHVLLIPNAHYLDMDEMPLGTLLHLMKKAREVVAVYKQRFQSLGYSIMQNGGQFNDVGHFHLHIFPRYNEQHFNFTYEDTKPNEWPQMPMVRQWLEAGLQTNKEPAVNLNFPNLQTERLLLNQLQFEDIDTVVQLAGNEKIARMTLNIPHPYQAEDAQWWIANSHRCFEEGTQYTFAVRLKDSTALIGSIGLILTPKHQCAAVGYWMGEPYWNRGYTSEALGAILKYGFNELKLNKIYATHLLSNPASGKVMIKNGMIEEGILMGHYLKGETYRNVKQYRLLREEWEVFVNKSLH
ncbi:MAG: GNAT family N-acetyltransferase [Bacteroidota bacterium]